MPPRPSSRASSCRSWSSAAWSTWSPTCPRWTASPTRAGSPRTASSSACRRAARTSPRPAAVQPPSRNSPTFRRVCPMGPARCRSRCRHGAAMRCRAGRCTCRCWDDRSCEHALPRHEAGATANRRARTMRYLGYEARARQLDEADALAPLRERFALPRMPDGTPRIYFCGHSLGLAPRDARRLVSEELDDWEALGVTGHHAARRPWIDYAEALRPGLARLAGAQVDEVAAMNSLTVNLHLLMASFYRPRGRRRCILIERGAFPSDRHAVVSQLGLHGQDESALIEFGPNPATGIVEEAALEHLLRQRGEEIALVLWPGVQYLSG